MPVRKTGMDVSVFTLNAATLIGDLQNATLNVEVASEEGKGVSDEWNFPVATGRSWTLEADVFVAASATLVALAAAGTALVTVTFNTLGNTYTGSGLVTSVGHQVQREGLQVQRVRIAGQGALTVTPPA